MASINQYQNYWVGSAPSQKDGINSDCVVSTLKHSEAFDVRESVDKVGSTTWSQFHNISNDQESHGFSNVKKKKLLNFMQVLMPMIRCCVVLMLV